MNKLFTIILYIFLLIAIVFVGWLFIQSLLEADPGITAAVIGAISVTVAGIWGHYSNRRREINSRHFIEKKNAYMHLINLIIDLFKSIKKDTKITEAEMLERLIVFKREVMVWGDQTVIEALATYERKSAIDPSASLLSADDLLRAIRKDLGHNDSQLKRGSLVGMLLIAKDREEFISNMAVKGSL